MAEALGEKPKLIGRTPVVAGAYWKVWLERMNDAKDRLQVDYGVTRAIADIVENRFSRRSTRRGSRLRLKSSLATS